MAGKRHYLPAQGEVPISDTFEIYDGEQEQTIRLDESRWAGFRDHLGEREFGVDEHGRSIELLRLTSPFTPFETALKARVGRLASFDNAGVGRALGVDHDDRSGRLVIVSERVAGVRLSELLDRAFSRSTLPDLAAALFVLRRLLLIADALHRETGVAHLALAPERIVITPRAGVALVEVAVAGAIEGLAGTGGVLPAELRPLLSGAATAANPRLDIARIAAVGVSMILGRRFESDEPIDPLSPVLQEVEEVAAIRADASYAFSLRQWLDRAVTVDPELSFPTFRDAHLALHAAQPPPDCVRLRPALARFVQALSLDSLSTDAAAIELERLRAVRVRQAASRVERPTPPATVQVPTRQDADVQEPSKTDDVFWRRAVAARFQMVRQQPDAEVARNSLDAPRPEEPPLPSADETLRLVTPQPAVMAPCEGVVESLVEAPAVPDDLIAQRVVDDSRPGDDQAAVPAVEESANLEETRLAWVRAVTQQLEAARSAERARADAVVRDAPPPVDVAVQREPEVVQRVPEVVQRVPEVELPEDPAPSLDEVSDAVEEVKEGDQEAFPIPSSLTNEPTLAELHTLLTAVNEEGGEKAEKKAIERKGSWLQAVKARLGFARHQPAVDAPETESAPEGERSSSEPIATEPVIKTEPTAAQSLEEAVGVEELPDLRARESSRQAWTAALTSALAIPVPKAPSEPKAPPESQVAPAPKAAPEQRAAPEQKAAPPPSLEVVAASTSTGAPRPRLSTPVPRPAPAASRPDFQETPRRSMPRWAVWAGIAAALAGGVYWYGSRSADSRPSDIAQTESFAAVPVSTTGSLSVTSQPPGATVILNGAERGVTPLTLSEVPTGNHRLQLRSEGGTVNRTIVVKAAEELRVDEAIFSGWIAVFAPFELQIFADGRQIGTTADARIMVPSGPHDVQLVNARLGYRQTHKLEVRPGEVSALNIPAPEGILRVGAPPGAEVWVDGRVVDGHTGELRVPIGTREVLVRHPQGEQRVLVTVTLSEPAEVMVGNNP